MPSPRRVIEWRLSRLSLRWRRRRARLGTKADAFCWPNLQVALCVADELLAHHLRAAIPITMRSRFPIGTCHKPTRQKQSHKSRQWETIPSLGAVAEFSRHLVGYLAGLIVVAPYIGRAAHTRAPGPAEANAEVIVGVLKKVDDAEYSGYIITCGMV